MDHLVTIGIPSYKRPTMLSQTLESVLQQTYRRIEVVVSVNAYDPLYREVLSKYRRWPILFLKHERLLSMGENWNQCLDHAHGYYFLLLSDDDILERECIEKLVRRWEHPEQPGIVPDQIGASIAQVSTIDETSKTLWATRPIPKLAESKDVIAATMNGAYGLYMCGTLIRTSDMKTRGRYDEHQYGALLDVASIFLCIASYRYIVASDEYLAHYRYTSVSGTSTAIIRAWIHHALQVNARMIRHYQGTGDAKQVRCLESSKKAFVSNTIAAILLRRMRGNLSIRALAYSLLIVTRYSWYFLNRQTMRRFLVDTWKLAR